jgi:hypothetical protein
MQEIALMAKGGGTNLTDRRIGVLNTRLTFDPTSTLPDVADEATVRHLSIIQCKAPQDAFN